MNTTGVTLQTFSETSQERPLLIVLTSFFAEGCPQLALQLANHWQGEGHPVAVLTLRSQPNDMRAEFEAIGVALYGFSLGRGLARYPRLAWQSYQLCRRLRPRAVLSFPLGWHAFLAIGAKAAGVPKVCAHVGCLPPIWTGNDFRKFKLMVQLGRPFTNRLLCCSEYIRKATVQDFSVRPSETLTVFNACDLGRFMRQSPHRKVVNQPSRIGVVGRLDGNRDYPSLIHAINELRKRGIPTEAWLIGDGTHRQELKALSSKLKLESHVQMLGNRRDIPQLLDQLDVFVWPAFNLEGFGIALAEAMAAGVPIVATDVGACNEVLDGGRCGLLVKPRNPEALADGIQNVLDDQDAARGRANAARKRALTDFSVSAMAKTYGLELGLPT